MERSWNDIKWIFEPDGSLRDSYVQEASIDDWEKLIDLLNNRYSLQVTIAESETIMNQIDKVHAVKYLTDKSGETKSIRVKVDLKKISMTCHFFLPDQIELDIDPNEVKSIQDFQIIEKFMEEVSKILNNQVTLTGENSPEFPLAKINYHKGISKVLTEQEAQKYRSNPNSIKNRILTLNTKLQFKFFPKKFEEKLLKSANEPHKSTKKNENVW